MRIAIKKSVSRCASQANTADQFGPDLAFFIMFNGDHLKGDKIKRPQK